MNKSELLKTIIKDSKTDMSVADVTKIFNSTFEVFSKVIKKDGRLAIPQFGIFKKTKRAARKGRNPQTGVAIKIKASKSVRFKPSVRLKGML